MKACPQCHIRYPADAVYCFLDGAVLEAIRDPLIGTTIAGRYVIEDVIGEGGMATVYRARHQLVDRPCAVKVMNPALAMDQKVRERFRREAKSAQSLAHPNVIEIFDQGETENGTPYIVMELLSGRTLAELTDKGPIPMPVALPIMIQMSRAIARAHDLGVVHRDLKPENIFITRRVDGTDLVKVLDFGIARSRGDTRLTNAGELFGTPQYLAPERITGGDAGASVDLYACGVIFFEMATGQLPFDAKDPTSFLLKHMKEKPPPPRQVDPRVPERLDALVVQLLEKDPKLRPPDAHAIELELVGLSRSLGVAVPLEPEDDPGSSRAPARTLPAAGVDQWVKRVALFDQMLARSNGAPQGRAELDRTLREVHTLVQQLRELRESSAREQHALEDIDVRGRDGRTRFGFAVDALGLDASKARADARTARAQVQMISEDGKIAVASFAKLQAEAITWEGRTALQEPHAQLARAYRACADSVDQWLAVRTLERAAIAAAEDKERMVSDLDYQIAELRTALTNYEQGIDRDREAAQRRLVELNAKAEQAEAQLLQLATRFCAPLRSRPELGALFQQLESDATAPS